MSSDMCVMTRRKEHEMGFTDGQRARLGVIQYEKVQNRVESEGGILSDEDQASLLSELFLTDLLPRDIDFPQLTDPASVLDRLYEAAGPQPALL